MNIIIDDDEIPNIGLKVTFQEIPEFIYGLIVCLCVLFIMYLTIRVLELFITRSYWLYCYFTNPDGDLDYLYRDI